MWPRLYRSRPAGIRCPRGAAFVNKRLTRLQSSPEAKTSIDPSRLSTVKKMSSRSRMIALLFLLASTACSQDDNVTETEPDLVARARGIHERVITLDTHNDISTANEKIKPALVRCLSNFKRSRFYKRH